MNLPPPVNETQRQILRIIREIKTSQYEHNIGGKEPLDDPELERKYYHKQLRGKRI